MDTQKRQDKDPGALGLKGHDTLGGMGIVAQGVRSYPYWTNVDDVESVWAALTFDPSASIVKLEQTTALPRHRVRAAIFWLEDAGYVTRVDGRVGTRQVVISFSRRARP